MWGEISPRFYPFIIFRDTDLLASAIDSGDYLTALEFTKASLKVMLIPETKGSFDLFCELVNSTHIVTHTRWLQHCQASVIFLQAQTWPADVTVGLQNTDRVALERSNKREMNLNLFTAQDPLKDREYTRELFMFVPWNHFMWLIFYTYTTL